jgi:hypothetical protein
MPAENAIAPQGAARMRITAAAIAPMLMAWCLCEFVFILKSSLLVFIYIYIIEKNPEKMGTPVIYGSPRMVKYLYFH